MPSRFDRYKMTDGKTLLGADYFNGVFGDVDLRLVKLEALEIDWEAATDELTNLGLSRINEVLTPLLASGEATLAELTEALENIPGDPVTTEDLAIVLADYVTATALTAALAPKADTTTVNAQLSAKADTATVNSQLVAKASITYVDTQIAGITTGTPVNTLSASATLTAPQAGQIFVDASGGPVTLTLPAATAKLTYRFTRVDSTTNQVTINRAGSDVLGIESATSAPLDVAGYTLQLTGNGSNRWLRTYSSPLNYRWDVPGSYSWRRPLDATIGEALIIGGGGGGASGGRGNPANGGQGGGGASAVQAAAQLPATATVVVAPGGNGGASRTSNGAGAPGTDGGSSSFGSITVAGGVGGGSGAVAGDPIAGVGAYPDSAPGPGMGFGSSTAEISPPSFTAVVGVTTSLQDVLDSDGSTTRYVVDSVSTTTGTYTPTAKAKRGSVYPAGCSGGWGANSASDNTPGFAGANHGAYGNIASGPSGDGGKSRRGANADPGQPGGIGSGGGGGGAAHNGNSGAGGAGGPGLVTLRIA